MKITKLILYKYIRLSLNKIEYFELEPKQKIQLILGSNSSGKSSCMYELSPLPANHQFYHKSGYKKIYIEHNNHSYELISAFEVSGNKYYFILDGEDINVGNTITTYKELVRQHFNYTQDIHELLIGQTNFHDMSTNERRLWLTRLSHCDYTYAFKYFNNLKDQLKDVQTSIKFNQSRLVQENNKLLTPEQEVVYRDEITQLKSMIYSLLEMKQPLIERQSIKQSLAELEKTINQVSEQCFSYSHLVRVKETNNIDTINDIIINLKSETLKAQDDSHFAFNEIQELQKQLKVIEHTSVESLRDTDVQITKLTTELQQLNSSKRVGLVFDDAQTCINAIYTIQDQLSNLIMDLPIGYFRHSDLQKLITEQDNLNQQLHIGNDKHNRLLEVKRNLEHARDHQQIHCPKCQHVWSQGYDLNQYTQVIEELNRVVSKIEQFNETKKSVEVSIELHRSHSQLIRQYQTLTCHWTVLNSLWAYIASEDILFTNPKYINQLLSDVLFDLSLDAKIKQINDQISDLVKLKDLMSNDQELDSNKIILRIKELELLLNQSTELVKVNKVKVGDYEQLKSHIQKLHQLKIQLETLLDKRSDTAELLIQSFKQEALNNSIQLLQLELNDKEQMISKVDIQKAIIVNIENSIKELSNKQELLKLSIKELSPTQGLIAKGLTSFFNHFVTYINDFIKQIWTYPLELIPILPDENEDIDLDYKFAVNVNHSNVISDIAKGSSAVKEIINLAFVIVSMKFLGYKDYPLLTDELGASMDKEHRKSIHKYMHSLSESDEYSQLFVVSHFEEMHGSFNNCDITVLCQANIPLSKDSVINQHCTMQ